MEKLLIIQETYKMSLEHPIIPESMKVQKIHINISTTMGHAKRRQEPKEVVLELLVKMAARETWLISSHNHIKITAKI